MQVGFCVPALLLLALTAYMLRCVVCLHACIRNVAPTGSERTRGSR